MVVNDCFFLIFTGCAFGIQLIYDMRVSLPMLKKYGRIFFFN